MNQKTLSCKVLHVCLLVCLSHYVLIGCWACYVIPFKNDKTTGEGRKGGLVGISNCRYLCDRVLRNMKEKANVKTTSPSQQFLTISVVRFINFWLHRWWCHKKCNSVQYRCLSMQVLLYALALRACSYAPSKSQLLSAEIFMILTPCYRTDI